MKLSFFKTMACALLLVPVFGIAVDGSQKPAPKQPVLVQPTQSRCRLLCPFTTIKNIVAAHPKLFYSFITVSLLAGASVGGYYLYKNFFEKQEETDPVVGDEVSGDDVQAADAGTDTTNADSAYLVIQN